MEAPKPPCPPGHSPMLAMPTSGRQRSHPSPVPAAPPRAALRLRGAQPGHTADLGGRSERKVLTPAGPSGQRTNYRVLAVLTVARSGDTSSQEPRSRPTGALGLGAGHGREGRAGPSGVGRGGAPSSTLSPGGARARPVPLLRQLVIGTGPDSPSAFDAATALVKPCTPAPPRPRVTRHKPTRHSARAGGSPRVPEPLGHAGAVRLPTPRPEHPPAVSGREGVRLRGPDGAGTGEQRRHSCGEQSCGPRQGRGRELPGSPSRPNSGVIPPTATGHRTGGPVTQTTHLPSREPSPG